jgi:transcription elongation factor S-II
MYPIATEQILKRANAIEYSVFTEFDGVSKEYNQKMRRLYLNLKDKKNPGLRAGVVSGEIAVERFCKMSAEVSFETTTAGRVLT